MVTLSNIFVKYGDRTLLNYINFVVKPGERAGLVGRNGAGKSTLLKIIAGEQNPHDGEVVKPSGFSVGYLHQDMLLPKGKTVIEETLTAFSEALELEKKLHELEKQLSDRTDYESDAYSVLIHELSETADRIHIIGADSMQAEAEKVLSGLGFKATDMTRLTDEFSGGWQMRIELAKMLLRQPDMLLLDEPTNHLDIESIIWLETFLNGYQGMAIIISHDRRFLDNVTNKTIEIVLGRVDDYKVPYSKFVELSQERKEKAMATYENQQRVIADKERTIARFMAKATKTKMAQSMQKQLDKLERVEVEEDDTAAMNLRFPEAPRSGEIVVETKGMFKKYGNLSILDNVDFKILRGERIAFVGQNGQGKTTLAKILIGAETATSGAVSLGYNVQTGYYAQNQAETLDPKITLLETMENYSPPEMRTKLRAMLGAFLFSGSDVEKKVSVLSGGERARLALACMLLRPFNFLVLDEPTNHLDMISKEVLKNALLEFNGAILVVSHDRDFLSGLTEKTIEFRDRKITEYLGDVNYFLDKRAVRDMREVEMKTAAAKNAPPPAATLDAEAKKTLQRSVQRCEKRIEELEAAVKKMEHEMLDPAFFNKPGAVEASKKYDNLKSELAAIYQEWEQALEQLG